MTTNQIEAIAREVYDRDSFPPTDEVWCNLYWLTEFAHAIEVRALEVERERIAHILECKAWEWYRQPMETIRAALQSK